MKHLKKSFHNRGKAAVPGDPGQTGNGSFHNPPGQSGGQGQSGFGQTQGQGQAQSGGQGQGGSGSQGGGQGHIVHHTILNKAIGMIIESHDGVGKDLLHLKELNARLKALMRKEHGR